MPIHYNKPPLQAEAQLGDYAAQYTVTLDQNVSLDSEFRKGLEVHYDEQFRKPISAALENQTLEYLHSGNSSYVTKLVMGDRQYAVRFIGGEDPAAELEKHLAVAERAYQYPRFEHIQAVDTEERMTVAPLLPGEVFRKTPSAELAAAITYDQLEAIYRDMQVANTEGIGFDGHKDNFLYDPQQGFFVVDLGELQKSPVDRVHGTAAEALGYQMEEAIIGWWNADIAVLHRLDTLIEYTLGIIGKDPANGHVTSHLSRMREQLQEHILRQLAAADSWAAYA